MTNSKFNDFALSESILKAVALMKFDAPTQVQESIIPLILDGKDVIVRSQTGSGKTAAFAIPICERVDWEENKPQVMILAPTRELAIQVKDDVFHLGRFKRIKVSALYGRSPFRLQEKELKQKTHVVVGTPGRVMDHIERGTLETSMIKYLVIDEADEMLKMGFFEQVEAILNELPSERVTVVLSATMPDNIKKLCETQLRHPVLIEIESKDPVIDRILQYRIEVEENQKRVLLRDVLITENPDSLILFCNTQQKVEDVFRTLMDAHFLVEKLHGGMEQTDRIKVMDKFRKGEFRYLIATDVAARGIDIDQIELVINYDVPNKSESYVHRIGRTGRIGNTGKAITFVSPADQKLLREVHEYIKAEIPLGDRPSEAAIESSQDAFDEKVLITPTPKEIKGVDVNEGILKIHINAGKKTKMRAVDVVGTLCSLDEIEASDIGIINIMDISTYVEILNNKGDYVLKALQNKPIKGRIRKVSKVIIG
ncbi:DEAD/DEAH box helicase [Fusibacter sp. 3D3]|uniref:DEAD/DEAH box helicase n=1 Tax=Fusibacter sp. 3D3 TaxID=1048380 RepID=UPI000853C8FD|nr:DEAD/DEAH box helicase [Fusibacter sp. 3D3]GAU76054.1 ATP-dependent RNA helicase YxiN [Fusibacter sp. 3D3]